MDGGRLGLSAGSCLSYRGEAALFTLDALSPLGVVLFDKLKPACLSYVASAKTC